MSSPNNQQVVTFTQDQLKELFMTFARELRKPPEPTAEELAAIENDQKARKARAEIELQRIAQRAAERAICSHTRPNGTSHTVHIYGTNNLNDYMLCQGCQAMIHAGAPPADPEYAKEFAGHIFDTALFNKHYLMTQQATTF